VAVSFIGGLLVLNLQQIMMPPFWSFGFHLYRCGYADADDLSNIINGMDRSQFPYVST
jgi:alpha-glucosidase (family GH31 glycosyl hydrolase)